ncbi:MAG: S-methyl-5-thioribose-1-phosphate isomerase [Chloroflexi bacterium]|nr:MAG: S-methyl-5-thioribose-1-phosphate isomerase [Chloroflexota bacterium]
MSTFHSIEWTGDALRLLDQRELPQRVIYREYRDAGAVAEAIRAMVTRGAPAIGASAAFGLALTAVNSGASSAEALRQELAQAADTLRQSRPTAVNLFWAIERVLRRAAGADSVAEMRQAVLAEAQAIAAEDVQTNRQIGFNALPLIPNPAQIMHHCNTGSLATVDYGTALGIIRIAHEQGRRVHAWLDETRPRLQGARLSAWELQQLEIPHTVIVDGASGHVMRTVGIDLCVVGADRVAANGDTANKIGTYNLALVAQAHDVPFYVAAPTSTVDLSVATGNDIPIESRPAQEVTHVGGTPVTPPGTPVANPAFDVTPARLITAIITEAGIAYPPFTESLAALVQPAA